mmetsp:Transcript_21842/g.40937  ORF Transcript_21842/g.40937 Transcript_21842/m.40937 type:complete len:306 (-) Transcript_21842:12-929(-)
MSSVKAGIDASIEEAAQAQNAYDEGKFEAAAQLFSSSASKLNELIRAGAVKDERSRAFLVTQAKEFKEKAKSSAAQADDAKDKDLVLRMLKLKGYTKKKQGPKASADDLVARFEKLQAKNRSTLTDEELEARIAKLGPSQFPNSSAVEGDEEDPEVFMALSAAAKANARQETDELVNSGTIDPELANLLAQLSERNAGDDALSAMLGNEGADSEQIDALIQQARDYARFGDLGGQEEEETQRGESKKGRRKKHSEASESDSYSTSSASDSTSDSDSDDSEYGRNKKSKKHGKGKKRATKGRWGVF